jgi:3-hydroxypropionyl-CoA synthetase (ADP-forming)
MEECATRGIKNVVIVSASFKEVGGKYAELQEEVVRIAKENGIRIIGPNCIGVFNPKNKLDTLFQFYERMIRPEPGHLAFLSQSGTFVVTLLERAAEEGLGISKIVSYGNRADVDEADLITYLGEDPDTKVISIYIEGVGDGRKLMEAAKRVVMKKPIIVCKGGKTEKSSQAAVSHTGNLAGFYSVLESAFKQSGIILANNMEDLYVMCKALITQPLPKGNNVAMVTNGMGTSVMAIDVMTKRNLELASYSENTKAVLKNRLLPFMSQGNPVDLTASATAEDYKIVIETLLQDPQVDIVIPFLIFQDNPLDDEIIDSIGDLHERYDKPILCWASGGPYTKARINKIESLGIPVYSTPEAIITASSGLVKYYNIKQKK